MEWLFNITGAAAAMNGSVQNCNGDEIVKSVSTDTRKIEEGALFIALSGERFDGHKFVKDAIDGGAVCAVVNKSAGDFGNLPVIEVEDTHKALRDLAEGYRMKFNIPVVGITGSVGKTSTKEMIGSVLKQSFKTHMTQGNFNNEIGLPLTVFNLMKEDQMMVLEMGMSAFGEISNLTKVARPNVAVITNIGVSHIEHLGSREGIRKAKFEIFEGLRPEGIAIMNGDDDLLWDARSSLDFETLYYGIDNKECDICAYDVKTYSDSSEFSCKIYGKEYRFAVTVPGVHHIYNALAAILVGINYGIDIDLIKKGVKEFAPSGLRQTLIELDDYKIIRDCYNASPASMKSGLEVLSLTETKGRRVACLADMLELGEISENAHQGVGELVVKYKIDCLITVGKFGHFIARGAETAGMNTADIYEFDSNDELKEKLSLILKKNDVILVKGSRGMKLEEIADAVEQL